MPTATYIALANTTLSGTAATITFSSIPATYRDLVVVLTGTATASVNANLYFNSDTTAANYKFVRMYGQGSGSGSSNTGDDIAYDFYTNLTMVRFNIMDYSATDKHKTVLTRWDTAANITGATAYRWANTNAITSVILDCGTSTFASGTTAAIYGIVS
jgi:hypothetical protein